MQLSNYHSHCTFCDGRSTPEDFVKFAISNHFRAYGFSSHAPLPFETFWNMSKDDMPEYITEIERLKEKYRDRIEIYTGLEIDYLDPAYHAAISYFQALPLDYRIGSIHLLPTEKSLSEKNMVCIDGDFQSYRQAVDRYYDGDIRQLTSHYFDSVASMVETGGIDIVGHIDKIYMHGHKIPGFSIEAAWYKKQFLSILELIAEKGLMVEINTKSFLKNGQLYPHVSYLPALQKRHIPVLVNSDCHYPNLVNDGRQAAFDLLKINGFAVTRELIDGKWEDIPLR